MHRGSPAFALVAVTAILLAGCGSSHTISPSRRSLPCNPKPQGALCLKIFRDGSKVTDIVAYFSASASPLTGKTWRLALTWGESGISPGPTRHGNPPLETYCKDSQGHTVTTGNGCDDTLASEFASRGDFPGWSVPRAGVPAPICVQEEIRQNGRWTPGPAKPACGG